MKLTAKCKYGLRILLQIIFEEAKGTPVNGKSISAAHKISEPYLEQIMSPLVGAKIVRSVRGPGGGYIIERNLSDVSLLEIIEAYEGKIDFSEKKTPEIDTVNSDYMKDADHILILFQEKVRESANKYTLKNIYDLLIKKQKRGEYMI